MRAGRSKALQDCTDVRICELVLKVESQHVKNSLESGDHNALEWKHPQPVNPKGPQQSPALSSPKKSFRFW